MFLNYYGLREQPFGVTPDPRYLYHSPVHREALASLIYGIEADLGFSTLIAEPGMGKTTLLFYVLEKFRTSARTALIFQTLCTPLELLRYLAYELEISYDGPDPVELNEQIKRVLLDEARAGRRVILIVDEAQNLDESVLEAIRLLSNFETPQSKLLHIILAGQPQLAEKLARPKMSQLLNRITIVNRLKPLTPEDTSNYINYRLGVAGYRGLPLFAPRAVEVITRLSTGVPRNINRICFNALSLGCALGKRTIDVDVVSEVSDDLDISDLLYKHGAISLPPDPPEQDVKTTEPPEPAKPPLNTNSEIRPNDPERKAAPAPVTRITAGETRRGATRGNLALVAQNGVATAPAPAPVKVEPQRQLHEVPRKKSEMPPIKLIGLAVVCALVAGGWSFSRSLLSARAALTDAAPSVQQEHVPAGRSVELPDPADSGSATINDAIRRGKRSRLPQAGESRGADVDSGEGTAIPNADSRSPEQASEGSLTSGDMESPALLKRIEPVYPEPARQAGIEGRVRIAALIGKDGRPRNVRIVNGHPLLASAAVDAVRQWVFQPYLKDGRPTEVDTNVIVIFDLSSGVH